jgi:dihydroorotase/N-acyl-D-amino-acid deacylase
MRQAVRRAVVLICLGAAPPAAGLECDLLFAGGGVVDGTGAPWFRADVCIVGDRIAAVGALEGAGARRRIDAAGLMLAPGFIDMLGQSEYNVLVDPRAASKITQGITTELTGEGESIAPLNERMIAAGKDVWARYGVTPSWRDLEGYFAAFTKARPAINLGTFVGAGGVRNLVMEKSERAATSAELAAMEKAVAQAMEQGAFGLSTSLQYVPDRFASSAEIVALARVAARYGGSYITHQRSEGDAIDASLDEVFRRLRHPAPGHVRRPGGFRPGDGARLGDLRGSAALQRGHSLRRGQRPVGGRRRQDHRRPAGPRAEGTGI